MNKPTIHNIQMAYQQTSQAPEPPGTVTPAFACWELSKGGLITLRPDEASPKHHSTLISLLSGFWFPH